MASPCALSFYSSTTTTPTPLSKPISSCSLSSSSSFSLSSTLSPPHCHPSSSSIIWVPSSGRPRPHPQSGFRCAASAERSGTSFSSFSLSSTLSPSLSISVLSSVRFHSRSRSRRGFRCVASAERSHPDGDGMDSTAGGKEEQKDKDKDKDKEEDGDEEEEVASMVGKVDWRVFRASLLRQAVEKEESQHQPWAHALFTPEVGCVLLAHPKAFALSQHYFHQAVIFLFHHGKDGSAGIILNRPTEYKLGQLAGFEDFLPEFEECPLYMGGDVGTSALHIIHGVPGLQDTKEIISGVYMGGFKSMKESIQNGQSNPMDYRWFARYAGWGPGQLEREVAAGVWYLSACSKHFILKPKPIWREILELMGAPYSEIPKSAHDDT